MASYPGFCDLLSAASATGDWAPWFGGKGMWTVDGTFGSGTVKMQWRANASSTALDVDGASVTANGGGIFELPPGQVRSVITGASGASLNSQFRQVNEGYGYARV